MASETEAQVIYLQSHPRWAAAQRRERQLREAISRHPAARARQRAAAIGGSIGSDSNDARHYRSAIAPA